MDGQWNRAIPLARWPTRPVVETFVANHREFLRYVERRVGSRAAAEEIVQEAFVRSLDHADDIHESVFGWFYRVLRNAVIDHPRRSAVSARRLEELAAEMANAENDEESTRVACRCVSDLAAEYADVLRRVEIDGVGLVRVIDRRTREADHRLMKRASFLGAILLVSCAIERPSAAREDLHGPGASDDSASEVGASTVLVTGRRGGGFGQCSATVVSDHAVVTAAHCVRAVLDVRTIAGITVAGAECVLHPGAARGTPSPIIDCDDYPIDLNNANIDPAHDLVLFRIAETIGARRRSLSPPRSCLATEDVEVRARGFSSGAVRLRLDVTSRPWFATTGGLLVPDGRLRIGADPGDGLDMGDSGGTFVEAWRDEHDGPLTGVVSLSNGDQASVWSGSFGTFERNVDWMFHVLRDAPGQCVLGPRRDPATDPFPWDAEAACTIDGVVRPDSDGDGIPDERDLCPRFDGRLPSAHVSTGEWANHLDSDRDFVGDDCDLFPHECNYAADDDHDGVPGSHDNCPDVANPGQEQCDPAVGAPGDACIPDDDHDGRPDRPACDDCIGIGNPDQHDCNLDAEQATPDAVVRGDACDPTPCGDTILTTRDVTGIAPLDPRATFRVQDQIWIDARSTSRQDARSAVRFCRCDRAVGDTTDQRGFCAGQSLRPCAIDPSQYSVAETAPDSSWRRTSLAYTTCAGADCRFAGVGGPAQQDVEMPATYSAPSAPGLGAGCRRDADCTLGESCVRAAGATVGRCVGAPFVQDLVATWQIERDRERWEPIYHDASTRPPTVPGDCGAGSGGFCGPGETCIRGSCTLTRPCTEDRACGLGGSCRGGICIDYQVCTTDTVCDFGFVCRSGLCQSDACSLTSDCPAGHLCGGGHCAATTCDDATPCGPGSSCQDAACVEAPSRAGVLWTHTPGPRTPSALFPSAQRSLTSHYWSGPIAYPRFLYLRPLPCPVYLAPFLGSSLFPAARGSFPAGFLTYGGVLDAGRCLPTPNPFDPFLDLRGYLAPATDFFPHIPIGDPALRWIPASEPDEWLSGSSARYAGLDPNGTVVRTLAIGVAGFAERVPCGGSGCGKINACQGQVCPLFAIDPDPEPGVPVLSATRDTLYTVGATDGVHVRTVSALPLSEVEASPIELGSLALGPILAATYSPVARALYVLDDLTVPGPRRGRARPHGWFPNEVRLTRIPVDGGAAIELDRWRVPRAVDAYAIAEDPAGFVYLVMSSERWDDHLVARLDPATTPPEVVGVRLGRGRLASPFVRADANGLSLAVGARDAAHVIGYRPAELSTPRGRRVGQCF